MNQGLPIHWDHTAHKNGVERCLVRSLANEDPVPFPCPCICARGAVAQTDVVRMVDSLLIVNPSQLGRLLLYYPEEEKRKEVLLLYALAASSMVLSSSRSETTRRVQTTLHCRPTAVFVRENLFSFFFSSARHNTTNRPISLDLTLSNCSDSFFDFLMPFPERKKRSISPFDGLFLLPFFMSPYDSPMEKRRGVMSGKHSSINI